MATADEYAAWIVKNADKKGTPAFDTVAAAYKDSMSNRPTRAVPTNGSSGLENTVAGVGKTFTDLALGAKQRLDDGAAYLERKFGGQSINKALGLKNAADIQKETQAAVDEKRRIDAPLMQTTGGKVGAIAGAAIPAIAAAFVPGGQTLAASILTGAGLGAVQPTATDESVAGNMLTGAVGGAAGYGLGKGIGYLANKAGERTAQNALANIGRDGIATQAKEAGYVIPPTQTKPNMLNSALEGLSGKAATAQKASIKNQPVTNKLAADALGLDPGEQISKASLQEVRTNAGKAYDALENVGTIKTDPLFLKQVDALNSSNAQLSKDFPELANASLDKLANTFKKDSFDSGSVVAAMKQLRFTGGANKASLDPATKELGRQQLKAAEALEGLVDRNLSTTGQSQLLDDFRNARQMIAKSYSVEKSLNDSTGNVIASKLAKELAKGKPLSGGLKQIAEFGQTFPKAAQEINSSMPGISPLDYIGAGGLSVATSNPLALLAVGARPAARSLILSKGYQNALATPSYGGNAILNALASDPARISMQAYGTSPKLAQ
jgi:hypothetical protein